MIVHAVIAAMVTVLGGGWDPASLQVPPYGRHLAPALSAPAPCDHAGKSAQGQSAHLREKPPPVFKARIPCLAPGTVFTNARVSRGITVRFPKLTSDRLVWGGYRTASPTGPPTLGYTGHVYDPNAGLVYGKARWYAPELGTWMSEDPVGALANLTTPNGLGAWLYANGNPTRYTDPTGQGAAEVLAEAFQYVRQLGEAANDDIEELTYRSAFETSGRLELPLLSATEAGVGVGVYAFLRPAPLGCATLECAENLKALRRRVEDGLARDVQSSMSQELQRHIEQSWYQIYQSNGGKMDENEWRLWGMPTKRQIISVADSSGQPAYRTLVETQDDLLQFAELFAGGSLDNFKERKPGFYVSNDGLTEIEWNPVGHASTNEGPHVAVKKRSDPKSQAKVIFKAYIRGWEQYVRKRPE